MLPEAFPNREDTLTLASVPVPLLDSTTQVCWKSDNPSAPDTTLTPSGAQYSATRSNPEQRKPLRYEVFAALWKPLQHVTDHSYEQISLGPYSEQAHKCLVVTALPSALDSSKLALPSRDMRSKITCVSHDW
jgi:hypothetical protein